MGARYLTLRQHANGALPGVAVAAHAPGLILWDVSAGPDWSEGDAGRFTLEAVNSADWAADGLISEFDTIGAALAAKPALVSGLLDTWEAEEHAAPRPCPDMLIWIAECRADLPAHMAEVQNFADHLATLGG